MKARAVIAVPDELVEQITAAVLEQLGPRDPWIDADEAAVYLSTSKQRIYALVAQKRIPHVRYGKRLLFRRSDIDQWLKEQT